MNIEQVTPEEFGRRIGLFRENSDNSVFPSEGVARLIRKCIRRWGIVEESRVRIYLIRQLCVAGWEDGEVLRTQVKNVIDLLVDIDDVARCSVYGRKHLAPSMPRAVKIADHNLIILGATTEQLDSSLLGLSSGPIRRVNVKDDNMPFVLKAQGLRLFSLAEWRGTPDYFDHLRRREATSQVLFDERPIRYLWDRLIDALQRDGLPVGEPEAYQILSGRPGGYFSNQEPMPGGRWNRPNIDGTWIGRRRGYGDQHWHYVLLQVEDGEPTRAFDFYNKDEVDWAILARGVALWQEEAVDLKETILSLTFPAPKQLLNTLRLVADPAEKPWSWRLPEGLGWDELCFW